MNIYEKLMKSRIDLQSIELSKSGNNKFANYKYFELADFLPQVTKILSANGLCSVISFDTEYAKLSLYDVESKDVITITSPFSSAALKGAHDIQNIGAVETYQRRYLYVALMDIVEHDALDASEPVKAKPESAKSIGQSDYDKLTEAQKRKIDGVAEEVINAYNTKGIKDAYDLWELFKGTSPLTEEYSAARGKLPSHIRTAFGKYFNTINPPEHKPE